ncbi:MAG TPA: YbaB/EbfC family nucleoid-associated protein [Marmoricola sp.]|nr:YbaB/EbfC family nucleoid-associated protein [Marmoricola sp.]
MTQNPFGGPTEGGGDFDLGAMLEQAQQMQAQLLAAQEELAATRIEGSAGGVTVSLTGTGELAAVTVRPGSFDGDDADSLADLGDLVVAAYRDGKARVDALASEKLGPLAGGLGGGEPGPGGAPGQLGFGGPGV